MPVTVAGKGGGDVAVEPDWIRISTGVSDESRSVMEAAGPQTPES
jgi:hypothetical protein